MSTEPQIPDRNAGIRRQLAGRWQIPLLAIALGLLGAGLWRLRPEPPEPTFEELYANALNLEKSQLYPEASEYIQSLLSRPELTAGQRRRLYGLLARVIYLHEAGNVVHGQNNLRLIIEYSEKSLDEGEAPTAEHWLMQARAWDWQRVPARAVECYRAALAAGAPNPWDIRRRILDIALATGQMRSEELASEYEAFLAGDEVSEELRGWAAEQMVKLLSDQGNHAEASAFLERHAGRLDTPRLINQREYLLALVDFRLGRVAEAENRCRMLRDRLVPGHPLYAPTGWLLGRIMQTYQAPEPALSFFEEVIDQTTPGPYRTLCVLGRAETLTDLHRYTESLEAYERVIREVTDDPYSVDLDLQTIRQSTTQRSEQLRLDGQLDEALAFLRIAHRLAPPADTSLQITYTERLADLLRLIGLAAMKAVPATAPAEEAADPATAALKARQYLAEAAERYLELARLTVRDEAASVRALWQAAEAFDRGGEHRRVVEVLEAFIQERPEHLRVSEALSRIGAACEAAGDLDQAIDAYRRNLDRFPRTIWTTQSLVPLARCLMNTGREDEAEQTLMRIVDRPVNDPLAPVEPEANEYREALFLLSELYHRRSQCEKAIARLEEIVVRYPDDPRLTTVFFRLAQAHTRSAAQIRQDLSDPARAAHRDHLRWLHQQRLTRAEEIYARLIDRLGSRPAESLSELERLYLKLSCFYRADAIYDRSHVLDPADTRPYLEALPRYDQAAWLYQHDPMAMSAYVQMINCHLRLGNVFEARKTLQRAGWALRNIPDERFQEMPPQERRDFWEQYLAWLGRMPMLAADDEGV